MDCARIVFDPDTGKLRCFIHRADFDRWLNRRKVKVIFT